jgi:hypothetical protein
MTTAAVFFCKSCRNNPSEECGDACEASHVEALPPVWSDYWPSCPCCEIPLQIREVMAPIAT